MTTLEFARKQKKTLEAQRQLLEELKAETGSRARAKVLNRWAKDRGAVPPWASSFQAAEEGGAGSEYVRVKLEQIKTDLVVVERVLESEQRAARRARR